MAQITLVYRALPQAPLDAAGYFAAVIVPEVRQALAGEGLFADILREEDRIEPYDEVVIVLSAADHTHRAWRLAAIQGLAREAAPGRVNAVAGDDQSAISATVDWLHGTPGVTGQVLETGPR